MSQWIAELSNYLSEDARQVLGYLAAMTSGLFLVRLIIAQLQSKEIKAALHVARSAGISFSEALAKQATPPKQYPCIQFFLELLFTINNYFGSLAFFSLFIIIGVLTTQARGIPFANFLAAMGLAMMSLYFTLFLFAEAERGRHALTALLSKCHRKDHS